MKLFNRKAANDKPCMALRALGAMLTYPGAELREALPEIMALLDAEPKLGRPAREGLHRLLAFMGACDPFEAEERYVDLFDRGRHTSLNLFEHVHGESRDRGPAMVDLLQTYERAGFELEAKQLPDYLPVLLEFLSTRPLGEAREMLADCAHILRALGENLRDRDSPYAAVFAGLLELAGEAGFAAGRRPAPPPEPGIDEQWQDAEVVFGPGAARECATSVRRPAVAPVHFMPRV